MRWPATENLRSWQCLPVVAIGHCLRSFSQSFDCFAKLDTLLSQALRMVLLACKVIGAWSKYVLDCILAFVSSDSVEALRRVRSPNILLVDKVVILVDAGDYIISHLDVGEHRGATRLDRVDTGFHLCFLVSN